MNHLCKVTIKNLQFEEIMIEDILNKNSMSSHEYNIIEQYLNDIRKELKIRVTINKALTTSLSLICSIDNTN